MKILVYLLSLLFTACTTVHPVTLDQFDQVSVKIENEEGDGGSGVIFKSSPKGSIILTNAHICDAIVAKGTVYYDAEEYPVSRYKISKIHDICYIFVKQNLFVNTSLANKSPKLHSEVFIAGHPHLYPNIISTGRVYGTINIKVSEARIQKQRNRRFR